MNAGDIKLTDWMRILFGDAPFEFMIEVVVRIFFIYIFLIIGMRLMGRRMEAMITRNELIALVTLAAAVGVAILSPDRGLLPPVVVIVVVVSIQHIIAWLSMKSAKNESLLLDDITPLIKDGEFQLAAMKKSRITRARLISELRTNEVVNLGCVQRAYMEAKGDFSILTFEEKKVRKGLCILPEFDNEFRKEMNFTDDSAACKSCGNVVENTVAKSRCNKCGQDNWEKAIISE